MSRIWLKVINDLESLETLLGHANLDSRDTRVTYGALGIACDFCKACNKYVEAVYTVVYDSDMLEKPAKVSLCNVHSADAIKAVGITEIPKVVE
jgi:hypothetical protein